jgi:predicted amidohydrolase YtcJ
VPDHPRAGPDRRAGAPASLPPAAAAAADLVFHGGTVLTMEPACPVADALAVGSDGRILAAGTRADVEPLVRSGTRRIDLAGRTLVPGFHDAHVHVWKVGHLLTTLVDLRDAEDLPAIARAIRESASSLPPGAWVLGRGYNEARLAEGRAPTRHDLDAALPGRLVYLTRTCGHIGVASTAALRLAGVGAATTPPSGGAIVCDERGEPTGELHETAMGVVTDRIPEPTAAEYQRMIVAAARHQLARGITSATDAGVTPELLAVYRDMDARGALPYRVNAMALRHPVGGTRTYPLPERHASDFLRIDSIKLLADGGLSGATAALRVPYRHCPDRGVLRLTRAQLVDLAWDAHAAGLRIATHAIGDAAIEEVLAAYEALAARRPGPCHRIEHFGLPSRDHLRRAAALRVIAVPQTVFIHALGANFRRYLPDSLVPQVYPVAAMLAAGLCVALSSDAPVVKDDDPLLGIQAAVTRRDASGEPVVPEEAITAAEALYAYTVGGARASGDDATRGSLTRGKWADLTVLDANPLEAPPGEIARIRVDMTVVGGRIVHERG